MKKGRTMAIGGMKRSESIQRAMCLPPRTSIRAQRVGRQQRQDDDDDGRD